MERPSECRGISHEGKEDGAQMKAEHFLNEDQRRVLSETLLGEGSRASGEIAVTVLDRSNRYLEAQILGAFIISGILSGSIAWIMNRHDLMFFIIMVVLLLYPARRIMEAFPALQLFLVSRRRVEDAVQQRAIQTFYDKGLHLCGTGTGILIFISLLERKVWILGDRGVKERAAPGFWKELSDRLADGIGKDRSSEALCEVISRCARILRLDPSENLP